MLKSGYKQEWLAGMRDEINIFDQMDVCSEVDINTIDKTNILPTSWRFQLKKDLNGNVWKFRLRLVMSGHRQIGVE